MNLPIFKREEDYYKNMIESYFEKFVEYYRGVGFSNIFKANKDRLLLQDQTDLTIIEPDGTHWNTERISWDGLAEINVENNLVSGLAYNPMPDSDEWVEFKYDLDTKTLTGGSYYSFENKKPWWKIW